MFLHWNILTLASTFLLPVVRSVLGEMAEIVIVWISFPPMTVCATKYFCSLYRFTSMWTRDFSNHSFSCLLFSFLLLSFYLLVY